LKPSFWIGGILTLAILASYFFDRAITPNPTSRFLPVITFVEDGSWKIDRLKDWTQDKAKIGEHYYSDKAPFSSWLVVPFDFAYMKLFRPDSHFDVAFALGILLCGLLPFLFLVGAIFVELGLHRRARSAVWLSTVPLFGSPLVVYSGTFFGHLLAGALILASWLIVKQARFPIFAGLLGGMAVPTEYPTAVLVLGLGVSSWMARRQMLDALQFCLGGSPALIALLSYNWALTGSPFHFAYSFEDDPAFQYMKTAFGFGLPSLAAMIALLVGPSRGLLIYAPATAALAWSVRRLPKVWLHPMAIATVAFFVVISAYKMYWGGWTFGPRYLLPALFLVFYEGLLWFERSSSPKWLIFALSSIGVFNAWLANATVTYMIPENYAYPYFSLFWPDLLAGNANANNLATLLLGVPPIVACILWLPLFVGSLAALHVAFLNKKIPIGTGQIFTGQRFTP
jgi:hypothetical protein